MGMMNIAELRIFIEGVTDEDKGLRDDMKSLSLDNMLLVQLHNELVNRINEKDNSNDFKRMVIMAQYIMDHYEVFEAHDGVEHVMAYADVSIKTLKDNDPKRYKEFKSMDPVLVAGKIRALIRVLEGERIIFDIDMHQYSIYIDKDFEKLESTRKRLEKISTSYPYCTFTLQTLTNEGMDVMVIRNGETGFGTVNHEVFKGDYKLAELNINKLMEEGWFE